MINCFRSELKYRIEIVEHLNKFGIDESFLKDNVIFADDFVKAEEAFESVESVALVDFNQLPSNLEPSLKSKVHYIVDHHIDNKVYLDTLIKKEI